MNQVALRTKLLQYKTKLRKDSWLLKTSEQLVRHASTNSYVIFTKI